LGEEALTRIQSGFFKTSPVCSTLMGIRDTLDKDFCLARGLCGWVALGDIKLSAEEVMVCGGSEVVKRVKGFERIKGPNKGEVSRLKHRPLLASLHQHPL